MQQRQKPQPDDKPFHSSMLRPWRVPLPVISSPKAGGSSWSTLIYGFAGIIAVGTILLMLPISSKTGQITSPINALFTATSAVCVTGLVVVDTGTYWSSFGQVVVLILFQIGGFGFMTSATVLFLIMGRRIGLRERLLIGESVGMARPGGVVRIVKRMAIFTLMMEGIGAIILFLRFLTEGTPAGLASWKAVFHAISAFNNAGFEIFGNFRSLLDYQRDPAVLLTIAALFIIGGIGYIVVDDMLARRSFNRLSTDSKIVLVTSLSLLISGTIFILFAEFSNPATLGVLSFPQKLLVSFFQSATPRTAGFTAIDMGKLIVPSLFYTMFLMFVGGAAGSTAGGVKVNTFGVLMSTVWSSVRGREHTEAFGREFTAVNVFRALALVVLYLGLVAIVVLALSITEKFEFVNLLFETFSALSTVGLTTGITPELSVAGRLIITATMFVGRLGHLTFVSFLTERQRPAKYRYPKDIVRIG
ncbi:MAG: TrkH family potassium uptake protein [Dehalococcoidales bacterium]|nr:TrkH family potassium uptake protein [Dehalococcoidales bacterium]